MPRLVSFVERGESPPWPKSVVNGFAGMGSGKLQEMEARVFFKPSNRLIPYDLAETPGMPPFVTMAGFQVTTYGRFWVTAEVYGGYTNRRSTTPIVQPEAMPPNAPGRRHTHSRFKLARHNGPATGWSVGKCFLMRPARCRRSGS